MMIALVLSDNRLPRVRLICAAPPNASTHAMSSSADPAKSPWQLKVYVPILRASSFPPTRHREVQLDAVSVADWYARGARLIVGFSQRAVGSRVFRYQGRRVRHRIWSPTKACGYVECSVGTRRDRVSFPRRRPLAISGRSGRFAGRRELVRCTSLRISL